MKAQTLILVSLTVSLMACSKGFESASHSLRSSSGGPTIPAPGPGGGNPTIPMNPVGKPFRYTCQDPQGARVGEGATRRLTKDELTATLKDLLGDTVFAQLNIDLLTVPSDSITDAVTEFQPFHNASHLSAYLSLMETAAEAVVTRDAVLTALIGSCAIQATIADSCFESFLSGFGLRTLRRPLNAEEKNSYTAEFRTASRTRAALRDAMMRLLLSPEFMFHMEVGTQETGMKIRLTNYEIASRLAYRLTGTMPDAELFAAAAGAGLQSLSGVRAQAQRLLASVRGKAKTLAFFDYWLKLSGISNLNFSAAFLGGISTVGLREEMVTETRDYVAHILWSKKGTYKDLMTSPATFAKSARMAQIYQTTTVSDMANPPSAGDGRIGLLMRASSLVSGYEKPSPIMRGVLMRKRVLCDPLPLPSAEIIANRTKELGNLSREMYSNREIVTRLTEPANCMGCHSKINPIGFAMEGYDSLGRKQSVEKVLSESGQVLTTHPVDTAVGTVTVDGYTSAQVTDANTLATAISDSMYGPACLAVQVFRHTRVRMDSVDDECNLAEIERTVRDSKGNLADMFLVNVANENIFWKSAPIN